MSFGIDQLLLTGKLITVTGSNLYVDGVIAKSGTPLVGGQNVLTGVQNIGAGSGILSGLSVNDVKFFSVL